MMLDTSAWVEYLKAAGSFCDLRLQQALMCGDALILPAVVLQEVLQGARSPVHYLALQRELDQIEVFDPLDVHEMHRQAGLLYARCRWQGVTVRSPMDCVVAACAIEAEIPLLASDRDFSEICRIEPKLKLVS